MMKNDAESSRGSILEQSGAIRVERRENSISECAK